MASPAARRVCSHAGSKARLGQTIRREGLRVFTGHLERHLVIAQRQIVRKPNSFAHQRLAMPFHNLAGWDFPERNLQFDATSVFHRMRRVAAESARVGR